MNDLLFCPFCGNDNQDDKTTQVAKHDGGDMQTEDYFEAHVECDQCDCVGPFTYMAKTEAEARQKAREHWNHRAN